jgi:two-component system sensor histidine kinase HydH
MHILVANAIEATALGGRVTGQVATAGGKVEIRIADTGRGIAPEHLGKLFSLFFTTKPRGLGIGLTLAHRAIERFGGTIRADSTPGAGTVFIIELPAA